MIVKRALIVLLVMSMLLSMAMPYAVAGDQYNTVKENLKVTNGQIESVNSCYMTFSVINGSVHVAFNGPGYPYKETNIPAGQTYYYYNILRVYVASADNDTAIVDIAEFVSSSDPASSSGTKVSCDVPGQTALGGDVVSFPVIIQNNDPSDHTYELSSFSEIGWKTWFEYGDKGVYKISVPSKQSRTVELMVQTWGNTPVGEKKVVAYVDNARLEVFVDITSANQSADVSFKVGSKIANIGDKINYDLHIKNVQAKENIYKLAVAGLPENWYARFKETASATDEIAEVVIPASSDKDLVLEIVPSYSVAAGNYNFTSVVTTPDAVSIKKDLTLTLKSGTGMSVTSSRLAYEAKPGETFDILVYVSNTGQGAALTNVYLEAKAPEGWLIQSSPNRTNSIKAGDTQAFTLAIQPPGNIVASDYEVNVKAKSDQAEKEKDYRITIKTESYVPYIGAGIIVLVGAGLFFIYRKYGRR
jgi:uncharacterized membrane protein